MIAAKEAATATIMTKQARILVEGRLQGFNFRLMTQEKAQELGLGGFVRTLSDGRIEIEAQGSDAQLEALLTWCQQEPHSSQIKNILYRYDDVETSHTSFSIR
jgi:acylphosphatase